MTNNHHAPPPEPNSNTRAFGTTIRALISVLGNIAASLATLADLTGRTEIAIALQIISVAAQLISLAYAAAEADDHGHGTT
ncbi:hypothetical protein [Mycobacterium sp. NPDC006124]|uniref:hypothetical protein n=1 Tax=Mycobacterium sp. NPDC006124 TaxID=3156729 RepID=UPI00339FAA62